MNIPQNGDYDLEPSYDFRKFVVQSRENVLPEEADELVASDHEPLLGVGHDGTYKEEQYGVGNGSGTKSRSFYFDMFVCFFLFWVAESARGLVVGEIAPYVQQLHGSASFLGLTVSIFSLGRLPSSVLFGWWSERRTARESLMGSLVLAVIGSVMYCFASVVDSRWMLLLARFVQGFATGNFGVVRAYIASITTKEERTQYLSWGGAVQFIGFGLMPSISAWISINKMIAGVPVTPVTIPGWILVGMNLISMVLVIFMNEAKNARSIPNSGTRSKVRLLDEDEEAVQDPSSSSSSSTSPSSKMRLWILYSAPILCLLLNFLARGVLSIVETDGPYTCQETAVIHHHINATTAPPSPGSISERLNPDLPPQEAISECANYFTVLGVVGLVVYLGIDYFPKRILSEFSQLLVGFVFLGIGCMILGIAPTKRFSFISGTTLLWSLGSPITQTLTLSICSKLLGNGPQGLWMGWMGSAGSLGRILFPLVTGYLSQRAAYISGGVLSSIVTVVVYYAVSRRYLSLDTEN